MQVSVLARHPTAEGKPEGSNGARRTALLAGLLRRYLCLDLFLKRYPYPDSGRIR